MKAAGKHLLKRVAGFLERNSSRSVVGFARSILAVSMLLKLLFNNIHFLIPASKLQSLPLHSLSLKANFFLLFSTAHLQAMQIFAILILLVLISGYFMRLTCLLQFWLAFSLYMLRPDRIGVENIEMLLALLLLPVCLFDERKNHWHKLFTTNKFNTLMQNIFLFLIKLQVIFIYYDSVHDKLLVKSWRNGTVIYYWFTHNFYGLHPYFINLFQSFLSSIPVLIVLAWSTMAFEALLAVAFVFSFRYRLILLKGGIIFHFAIVLIHGFSFLFFTMSAALFLYLYPAKKPFSIYFLNEK